MNLQCVFLHLAVISSPPAPRTESHDNEDMAKAAGKTPHKAANDNQIVWPLMPFPEDWCASN